MSKKHPDGRRRRRRPLPYGQIDWSQSDCTLGQQHDRTTREMRAIRRRMGQPPYRRKHAGRPPGFPRDFTLYDFRDVQWHLESLESVAARKGCSTATARKARTKYTLDTCEQRPSTPAPAIA